MKFEFRVEARPRSGHTEHSAGDCDVSNTSWIAQRSERQKKFCFLMAEQTAKCLHLHRRVSLFFCCRRYAEVPTLAPQEPDGSFGRVQARDTTKTEKTLGNASIPRASRFLLCQCTLKTAYCKREDMTAERSATSYARDRKKTSRTKEAMAGDATPAIRSSEEERRVDALALRAEERRDKLRKASGRSKYPLIRGCLNGETRRGKPPPACTESIGACGEPGELKHLSTQRKRKKTRVPK